MARAQAVSTCRSLQMKMCHDNVQDTGFAELPDSCAEARMHSIVQQGVLGMLRHNTAQHSTAQDSVVHRATAPQRIAQLSIARHHIA